MRRHRIAKLIDRIDNDADCCIKADCEVGERNVVVDRAWQTHRFDAELAQLVGALVGAVAADNDKAVNATLAQNIGTALLAFRRHKLFAAGCLQYRTTALNNVAYAPQVHRAQVIVQKPLITALYAINFNTVIDSAPYDGADSRVHPLRIAAARKNGNLFNC
ncbi:hypothetical protein D3C84_804620 [compost metagenome]